jgi:hypothetical protein
MVLIILGILFVVGVAALIYYTRERPGHLHEDSKI